jgi:hypothetical protein
MQREGAFLDIFNLRVKKNKGSAQKNEKPIKSIPLGGVRAGGALAGQFTMRFGQFVALTGESRGC